jgi:hypothetical protein
VKKHIIYYLFDPRLIYNNSKLGNKNTKFCLFYITVLFFTLTACSDNEPSTVSIDEFKKLNKIEQAQLNFEVPSLSTWGKVSEIKMATGDNVELQAILKNKNGDAIANHPLFISSSNGNFFTEQNLFTDNKGKATSLLLATVVGKDKITVFNHSLGVSANLTIIVNDSKVNTPLMIAEMPGFVSWNNLAQVRLENDIPQFNSQITALNNKEIKIQGFMIPLESKHFILSAKAPISFFSLPSGAENMIDVFTIKNINISLKPIIVTGKLEVLQEDEQGYFYRIRNAEVIE